MRSSGKRQSVSRAPGVIVATGLQLCGITNDFNGNPVYVSGYAQMVVGQGLWAGFYITLDGIQQTPFMGAYQYGANITHGWTGMLIVPHGRRRIEMRTYQGASCNYGDVRLDVYEP